MSKDRAGKFSKPPANLSDQERLTATHITSEQLARNVNGGLENRRRELRSPTIVRQKRPRAYLVGMSGEESGSASNRRRSGLRTEKPNRAACFGPHSEVPTFTVQRRFEIFRMVDSGVYDFPLRSTVVVHRNGTHSNCRESAEHSTHHDRYHAGGPNGFYRLYERPDTEPGFGGTASRGF